MRKLAEIHKNPNRKPFIKPVQHLTIDPPIQPQYYIPIRSPLHTPARLRAMKSQKNLATNVTYSFVGATSPRMNDPHSKIQSFRPEEPLQPKIHNRTISQNCLSVKAKLSIVMSPTSKNSQHSKIFGSPSPQPSPYPRISVLKPLENEAIRPRLLSEMEAKSIISINDSYDNYLRKEDSYVQWKHTADPMPSPRYNRRESIIDAFYDGND